MMNRTLIAITTALVLSGSDFLFACGGYGFDLEGFIKASRENEAAREKKVVESGLDPDSASLGDTVDGDAKKKPAPRMEVVFVLDTTGSMSGLIAGAKEKIWAIANLLATSKPAPDIRIGLVAYRDRRDDYVTQTTALTHDIDAVYSQLMELEAQGGGDTPESVNQALHEAVTKMSWSRDETTYRVIFLVGDAPPHMDYENEVQYPESCKLAATAGIAINSIQCGALSGTQEIWTEIAKKAEGRYFRVDQSGGAMVASTPFDLELAELSKKLDATRIYYGTAAELRKAEERGKIAQHFYENASANSQAQRLLFNCSDVGGDNWVGVGLNDLVSQWADGKVELEKIAEKDLPESLRKLSAEERKKALDGQLASRRALQKQIAELGKKRAEHIKKAIAESGLAADKGFDVGIQSCVRAQAGKLGYVLSTEAQH